MPITTAERQRKYREKLKLENPEKLEELKRNNRERTRKNYKKIEEFSETRQKQLREKWRKEKKKVPNKNYQKTSEEEHKTKKEKRKIRSILSTENSKLKMVIQEMSTKIKNQKKTIYRYKKKTIKLTNIIHKLQEKNTIDDSKIKKGTNKTKEDLKKKKETEEELKTEENKEKGIETGEPLSLTPLSKTHKFINDNLPTILSPEKQKVKRALLESNVLKESLLQQYKQSKNNSERDVLKNVVNSKLVLKYKLKTKLSKYLGLQGGIRKKWVRKVHKLRRLKEIEDFLVRDDNSRNTAGKKEIKTVDKNQIQRRYLLDSLKNLHRKYLKEGGQASYTTFTRCKPLYVLDPKLSDRNTCACVRHENLKFMAQKLKQLDVIKSDNLDKLVAEITCNKKEVKCMYGQCKKCSKKAINYDLGKRSEQDPITWTSWVTKKHEYETKNKNQEKQKKITRITTKERTTGTIGTLVKTFSDQMQKFKIHSFNIDHQSKMYTKCKENLGEKDIIVHCDFSQNYVGKMAEEVQSVHFGASKQQITLHTGVIYYRNEEDEKVQEKSFCSVSPINDHGPVAVWAHLIPVLKFIRLNFPKVQVLHIFTDGPTTQYRNKTNFYIMHKKTKELGFDFATWSFFEASHGKGAADGVGGAVKRTLDKKVTYGHDITDAETAYNTLIHAKSKIDFFYITNEDIQKVQNDFDLTGLIPVPQTMTIHQILSTDKENFIKYRKLSCFCQDNIACSCYEIQEHDLKMKKILRKEKKKEIKYSTETSSSSEEEEEDTIIYMDTDDEPYDVDSDLEEADIKSITDVDTESDREPQDIKREKNRLTQHKGTNLRKISVSDEEKIVNYIDINTNDDIPAAQNKIQPELLAENTMSLDEDQESKVETVTVAQIHTEKPPIRRSPHLKTTKTSMLDEEQNKVYNSSSRNNRDTNIDLDVIEPLASIDNIDINRLPLVSDSFIIDDADVASDFSFSLIDVSKTSQNEANIQSRKRACDENKTDNICAKKRLKTKTRNCMKRKKTTTKNDREKKSEKPVLKCVGCEEDLISDAEDDDEKNIGCDKCPRWFHMRCTTKKGMSYVDVASQEFICHVCFV